MIAGLGLALGSALSTNVAFLFEQRGAVLAPPVLARHLLRSAVGLFRSRWFSLGSAVAVAAWGLHVGALALAPRRQWAGVIITAFGLAMICDHGRAARQCGASLLAGGADRRGVRRLCARCRADRDLDARQRRLCRGGTAAWCCGRGAVRSVRRRAEVPHRSFTGGLHGIVSEWTLAALAASVVAFYASARGLQLGPGVAVIAFTSVAANLAAIMGGILVFRDPIGIGALAIVGRVIAFGLVIVGAALMPAPLRAGEASGRSF